MSLNAPIPIALGPQDLQEMPMAVRPILVGAIFAQNMGYVVEISVLYTKQTECEPRFAGKDYVQIPGVGGQVLMGRVEAFRTKEGALRFRLLTSMRARVLEEVPAGGFGGFGLLAGTTTIEPGWATLIPEGISAAAIVGCRPRRSQD